MASTLGDASTFAEHSLRSGPRSSAPALGQSRARWAQPAFVVRLVARGLAFDGPCATVVPPMPPFTSMHSVGKSHPSTEALLALNPTAWANKSFDTDARRRAFDSLQPSPPGAGQLRR
jgi:hypothetical protein